VFASRDLSQPRGQMYADVPAGNSGQSRRRWVLRALGLGVITLASRALRPSSGLSYDELQSVTHAAQSNLVDALSSAWRFDPHPPLYYLQLHGWLEVVGVSEMGARANSWLISVLCSVALYAAAARHLGERIAFLATVLSAVAP